MQKILLQSKSRNVFEIATELHNKGHRAIVMVVGSDRVDEFDNLLNNIMVLKVNMDITVLTISKLFLNGERDPDAEGVEGMSASKMRGQYSCK